MKRFIIISITITIITHNQSIKSDNVHFSY